jgi:hypothetical protein
MLRLQGHAGQRHRVAVSYAERAAFYFRPVGLVCCARGVSIKVRLGTYGFCRAWVDSEFSVERILYLAIVGKVFGHCRAGSLVHRCSRKTRGMHPKGVLGMGWASWKKSSSKSMHVGSAGGCQQCTAAVARLCHSAGMIQLAPRLHRRTCAAVLSVERAGRAGQCLSVHHSFSASLPSGVCCFVVCPCGPSLCGVKL